MRHLTKNAISPAAACDGSLYLCTRRINRYLPPGPLRPEGVSPSDRLAALSTRSVFPFSLFTKKWSRLPNHSPGITMSTTPGRRIERAARQHIYDKGASLFCQHNPNPFCHPLLRQALRPLPRSAEAAPCHPPLSAGSRTWLSFSLG
jgi:hypothetical protein